ncbi:MULTISPECIES: hypothetical protein [unclassified Pseudoalteromonas]|uniref:hypothetical protein n=1 Tax=unclassified Pseudoalteromonas TaxID=194690 RepID=UPI00257E4F4F|nr:MULTISPECIES: hypothetical protein [unclassified Pseudoalteromonas]MDN3490527.1 hypothetical protein [Pseudoalteromonas sp. APC 3694]
MKQLSIIKEQLLTLGVVPKKQKVIAAHKAELAELLFEKLIETIINKESICKFYSYLRACQCRLTPVIRKNIRAKHQKAINSNSLDIIDLKNFIKSIDLEVAKKRFIEHENKKLIRRSKPKPKKRKETKPYKTPKTRKVSIEEKIEQLKATSTIGLGVESSFKIPKVRSSEVVIDKNTINHHIRDKSILYAAGWSLAKDSNSD